MSRTREQVQQEAEAIRRNRLEAAGIADQYDLWRESMPNARIPDNEVYEMFMNSQVSEEAGLEGKLSVSTGGTEVTADTDIPTPGPGADETRPGDTGETPEDADGPDADLNIVEGMWTPPEESSAVNYDAPSTFKMSRSKDWLENAKALYDYVKPNGEVSPETHGGLLGASPSNVQGRPAKQLNDEEIGEWARNQMSGFNWNTVSTLSYAQKIMTSGDPKLALAFLNLINMYDHSSGSAMDFAGAVGEVASDPTSYIGLGAGSVVAKGAALATAKAGLKKSIQMALVGGSAGLVEGGMLGGGFDLTKQNIEQEAGVRKDIDAGQVALATGIGAGLGATLGGVGGAWAGRKMQKFADEVERQRNLAAGAGDVLDERSAEEIGRKELLEMLQSDAKASDIGGQRDLNAIKAERILGEDGMVPLLDDGSLDLKKVMDIIDEVDAEHKASQAKLRAETVANDPVSSIEASGYKVTLGEENDILFDLAGMSDAKIDKIQAAADAAGVKVEGTAAPNAPGDQIDVSEYIMVQGDKAGMGKFAEELSGTVVPFPGKRADDLKNADVANDPFVPDIADIESQKLVQKLLELEELEKGDVVMRTTTRPGSKVKDELGVEYELVGRTKNGWYHAVDQLGREKNFRRKQFKVTEKAPAPSKAGPMELSPFSDDAAKIIAMNERIVSGKLVAVKTTTAEQRAIATKLREAGIDISDKQLSSYWTPAEMMFLRDTYNSQALGMADLARRLESGMRNNGAITNKDLAFFNQAHSQFVATRDLFFGVSGNAARQLQILRSKPTEEVYQFSQSLMDSISIQGGRANTERAIKLMADYQRRGGHKKDAVADISKMSQNIWGSAKAAAILNVRYNFMLSSWRTHFFNFLGNSASGVYQHLMVSPVRMGINNLDYARKLALSKIDPKFTPDPADRLTRHQYYAELRGHYASARDSLALAKEIAMGRDIGEGKVWNELGLRYNVINVPDSAFSKAGTTPVRLLEAGDAFFKNQYYNSKIHELASVKARVDQVHNGADYKTRYDYHLENPDNAMTRAAKEFAGKQTYTNDPSIYGGVLAALAKGVSTAQNQSLIVNMIVPFVRTPANLLSYSMEMIGANTVLSPAKTYDAIMRGSAQESQEALSRLTIAAGLWLSVAEMYQNGDITGTGPVNWEERKVWEDAGWQPNSIRIQGKWYDVSRAAPAGQSLATIASVFDYYSMTQQQDKPAMEWIGAGLLYTADMIIDESYLSTASDLMTAISSKEESRARSVGASMINSILVPNIVRDLRRVTDETKRSGTSTNLMDQVAKQMKNAMPWISDELPPSRDWKGDAKNYYGNAYVRGLIPFTVRDSKDTDNASMALAYSRIPVSAPNKTIDWPGGRGDAIDLFAMDNGGGFVYDKYLEIMGDIRHRAVNAAMETDVWAEAVAGDDLGPGSTGDLILRKALGIGSRIGRQGMLEFLMNHYGDNNTFKRGNGDTVVIQHQVSSDTYVEMAEAIRVQGIEQPDNTQQYIIKKSTKGPEFFKP